MGTAHAGSYDVGDRGGAHLLSAEGQCQCREPDRETELRVRTGHKILHFWHLSASSLSWSKKPRALRSSLRRPPILPSSYEVGNGRQKTTRRTRKLSELNPGQMRGRT